MAAGDQAHQDAVHDLLLTDDDFSDLCAYAIQSGYRLLKFGICRHNLILDEGVLGRSFRGDEIGRKYCYTAETPDSFSPIELAR